MYSGTGRIHCAGSPHSSPSPSRGARVARYQHICVLLLSVVPEDLAMTERDPEVLKEQMLSKLTPRQRTLRKAFLAALSGRVEEVSAELRRDTSGASSSDAIPDLDFCAVSGPRCDLCFERRAAALAMGIR